MQLRSCTVLGLSWPAIHRSTASSDHLEAAAKVAVASPGAENLRRSMRPNSPDSAHRTQRISGWCPPNPLQPGGPSGHERSASMPGRRVAGRSPTARHRAPVGHASRLGRNSLGRMCALPTCALNPRIADCKLRIRSTVMRWHSQQDSLLSCPFFTLSEGVTLCALYPNSTRPYERDQGHSRPESPSPLST